MNSDITVVNNAIAFTWPDVGSNVAWCDGMLTEKCAHQVFKTIVAVKSHNTT